MPDSVNLQLSKPNRRVLLIAYYYYQDESPASKRTKGLCKYLPEFGWEVTLLTILQYRNQKNTTNIIHAEDKKGCVQRFASRLSVSNNLNARHGGCSEGGRPSKNPLLFWGKWILNNKYTGGIVKTIYRILFPRTSYDGENWFGPAVEAGRTLLSETKYDAILSTQSPITAHCIARELKKEFNIPWIADYRDLWSQWDLAQQWKSTSKREREREITCLNVN